jgi:hypothetical protein
MLDGLVGLTFEVRRPGKVASGGFTVTEVKGNKASIVDADNRPSTVSVWTLMRSWRDAAIVAAKPASLPLA